MTPAEAAAIGEALHAVGVYDKQLFASIAAMVKVRWTGMHAFAVWSWAPPCPLAGCWRSPP